MDTPGDWQRPTYFEPFLRFQDADKMVLTVRTISILLTAETAVNAIGFAPLSNESKRAAI